ncbi:MAG: hypothetical protein KDD62_10245, partial [Bdellovibrionales bacterium]|nr:hypothetical protein [Bdellovibrionales bacterium]
MFIFFSSTSLHHICYNRDVSMHFDVPQDPNHDRDSGKSPRERQHGNPTPPDREVFVDRTLLARWNSTLELYHYSTTPFTHEHGYNVRGEYREVATSMLRDYFREHLYLSSMAHPGRGDGHQFNLLGSNSLYLDMSGDPGPLITNAFAGSNMVVLSPHEGCLLHALAVMNQFSLRTIAAFPHSDYQWQKKLFGSFQGSVTVERNLAEIESPSPTLRSELVERMTTNARSNTLWGKILNSMPKFLMPSPVSTSHSRARALRWERLSLIPSCSGDRVALEASTDFLSKKSTKFHSLWLQDTRETRFGNR